MDSLRKILLSEFLDALASLDLKLSVSDWVINRFQLAHIHSTGLSELFFSKCRLLDDWHSW